MPVATLNLICPKCRHVYEALNRTTLCPACNFSRFDRHDSPWMHIAGLLAVGVAIGALFGLGII